MPFTNELIRHTDDINELLARYGVKFGLLFQAVDDILDVGSSCFPSTPSPA